MQGGQQGKSVTGWVQDRWALRPARPRRWSRAAEGWVCPRPACWCEHARHLHSQAASSVAHLAWWSGRRRGRRRRCWSRRRRHQARARRCPARSAASLAAAPRPAAGSERQGARGSQAGGTASCLCSRHAAWRATMDRLQHAGTPLGCTLQSPTRHAQQASLRPSSPRTCLRRASDACMQGRQEAQPHGAQSSVRQRALQRPQAAPG